MTWNGWSYSRGTTHQKRPSNYTSKTHTPVQSTPSRWIILTSSRTHRILLSTKRPQKPHRHYQKSSLARGSKRNHWLYYEISREDSTRLCTKCFDILPYSLFLGRILSDFLYTVLLWCPRRDLNPHEIALMRIWNAHVYHFITWAGFSGSLYCCTWPLSYVVPLRGDSYSGVWLRCVVRHRHWRTRISAHLPFHHLGEFFWLFYKKYSHDYHELYERKKYT